MERKEKDERGTPTLTRGGKWERPFYLRQQSPTFLVPGTSFMEDNFSMDWDGGDCFRTIQAHYIYCALYFYYYYIVIYNEIIIQLTIMQNQWGPWACFPATRWSHLGVTGDSDTWSVLLMSSLLRKMQLNCHLPLTIGFWYESESNWFIMVSVQSNLSANDNMYLQPLVSAQHHGLSSTSDHQALDSHKEWAT